MEPAGFPESKVGNPLRQRVTEIDGLRGIAILLVLVRHYVGQTLVVSGKGSIAGYFSQIIGLTWSGVDLFFVLSGFLIGGILIENKGATNYFSVFYLRRVCRIFPLYFLVFGGFLVARTIIGDHPPYSWLMANPVPLWSYATFTQNILMAMIPHVGANWLLMTWSLGVEEQFYLVLPLLIWFLPRRYLPPVLLVLVCTAVTLRATVPGTVAFVGMPWRADSLLLGTLMAYGIRSRSFLETVESRKWLLRIAAVIFVLGTIVLTRSTFDRWTQYGGTFVHFWLALLYASLLLLALVDRESWYGAFLRNPLLVWFGAVSYGLYMYHQLVLGLVQARVGNDPPVIRNGHDLLMTGVALLITLLLATVSFYGMEQRILRWGHRFRYSKTATSPAETDTVPVLAKDPS